MNQVLSSLISIAENLIASGIVALLLIFIFRRPLFKLHLNFIPEKKTSNETIMPALDISVINRKRWVGFGPEEVLFGLLFPVEFINSKTFLLKNKDGESKWERDWRGANKITICGQEYFLCRQIVNLAVHPDKRTHFLRIVGDFSAEKKLRIYYYFETPFGSYPWLLKLNKRMQVAKQGKLPFAEVVINKCA